MRHRPRRSSSTARRVRRTALFALFALLACGVVRAAEFSAIVTDAAGAPVANAVVYLEPADGHAAALAPDARGVIDQVNKEFVPRMVVVTRGARVSFPNRDNIHHHVYSFSDAKKFELPLYRGTPAEPVLFDKAGVVTLGCNIHDWMRGYILVLDTPFFAATGADGVARVAAVPAGRYTVKAWHPDIRGGQPLGGDPLQLAASGAARAAFTIELKPALRIRRAPAGRRENRY